MTEIALISTDTTDRIYVDHRLIVGFSNISHDDMASLLGPNKEYWIIGGKDADKFYETSDIVSLLNDPRVKVRRATTPPKVEDRYFLARVLMALDGEINVTENYLQQLKQDRDMVTFWGDGE
jgi:hypothetical protein